MTYIRYEFFLICTLMAISSIIALEPSNLVIIILSQEEGYNAAQAELLKSNVIQQAKSLEKDPPQIILTHKLDIYGTWTLIPLIVYLKDENISGSWYIFCAENTVIRLSKLLNTLDKYNVDIYRNIWIGNALYDTEPTIIHHFAQHTKKFKYPNLASGFAISKHLLNALINKTMEFVSDKVDFSVDASYEFSMFILNESKGSRLTHAPEFCVVSNENCATYPKPFFPCDKIASPQNAYIAVKTCAKYHVERVSILRKTWTKYADNIGFFTDKLDGNLTNGIVVPNTSQGHCAKTYAILKHVAPILEENSLDWLVITDDDTILSLSRVYKLLTCYNPKNTLAIGERYGYRTMKIYGYDYLTGGSGVILSYPLVREIINSRECECPSATTPDDMFLFGVCLAHLTIKITHSPLFHQARPTDYAISYLDSQEPISFHKFWMTDPELIYEKWFQEADEIAFLHKEQRKHTEL
ncbi:PREDICTED: beta-1,3-glucosyltransferase [Ceratosolen solmsi marchali]|uniref:Beta-1,3-glucosyltransferase n=1 Tax=Ceratosolen solmsi marchali TaxID=326594 RepID=A0AAJ6YX99_9HYME|nr:PREDICTED: beta-1,3-glucosyltransferase [Ceratosolen solmsi marchali]